MAFTYKILTQNGVDNTNIDGARAEYFAAGMRDGIVKGSLNECAFTVIPSNGINLDTGVLLVAGHTVIITEGRSWTFTSRPSGSERRAIIAEITVDNNSVVSFDVFEQLASTPLIKNNMYEHESGSGTYQVEIGRFTLTTAGLVEDVVRTLDLITGGSSGMGEHFITGNVTTTMLESGMQANVTAEDEYDANGNYKQTNFDFEFPETAGTVITVNDVEQENISFTSDPQTQITELSTSVSGKANTNDNSQQLVVKDVTAQNISSNQTSDTKLNHLGIDWNTDNQNVGWVNYDRSADTLDMCNEFGDISLIPRKEENNVTTPQSVNIQGKLNTQGDINVENSGIYIKDDHGNNKIHIWHSNINNNDHIDFNGNRLFIYGQNPLIVQSPISDNNSSYGVTIPDTTGWTENQTIATLANLSNTLKIHNTYISDFNDTTIPSGIYLYKPETLNNIHDSVSSFAEWGSVMIWKFDNQITQFALANYGNTYRFATRTKYGSQNFESWYCK